MTHTKKIIVLALASFLVSHADTGAIRLSEGVKISETAQKAIIAHDGFEEILILGTNMSASSPTKVDGSPSQAQPIRVVRFIPFPAEPTVRPAPMHCFDSMDVLLQRRNLRYFEWRIDADGRELAAESRPEEPVRLLSSERIGSHDILSIVLRDTTNIKDRIAAVLGKAGFTGSKLGDVEERTIKGYVKDTINYFVFDIVDLRSDSTPILPLQYQFRCNRLYYPLRTSNTIGGQGAIELFIFCNNEKALQMERSASLPRKQVLRRNSPSVQVSREEMRSLAEEMAALMGKNALLFAFEMEGTMSFPADIWFPVLSWSPDWRVMRRIEQNEMGQARKVESLTKELERCKASR